jgi:exodeoxyribonuclease-5
MGDDGQLPPVGSDYSPALSVSYMQNNYPGFSISEFELNEVLRQANDSEILRNATLLRNGVWKDYPKFKLVEPSDFLRLNGNDLQDHLETSFTNHGHDGTIVITRSNKQANLYNQQIRNRILWFEDNLCVGDYLMVVKNSYFWLGEDSKIGFIANGEIVRIVRIIKRMELHGFEFARIIVNFVNYKDQDDLELIIHIESLMVEGPSLSQERMKKLFYSVEEDYAHISTKKKRYEAILMDPYFNALQVKYAYAITCHKSQGGQWSDVYIDQGFITKDRLGTDYYRWLYTALTRATKKVYLVNFTKDYFAE